MTSSVPPPTTPRGSSAVPRARASAETSTPSASRTPYSLRVAGDIGWRVLVVVACLYVAARVFSATREVVMAVLVALLLTALLEPISRFLRRRLHLHPYLAAAVTLLLFVGVVAGLVLLVVTQMASGMSDLAGKASTTLTSIESWLETGPLHLGSSGITTLTSKVTSWIKNNQSELTTTTLNGVLSAGGSAMTIGTELVIALVSLLFFLADGGHIWGWFVRLLPREAGRPFHEGMRRAWASAGAYVRTQLVVAVCDAIGIGLGALFLGLPMVIPIAVLVVICAFIPIVGAIISGAVAVLIALAVNGVTSALIMLVVVIAVQQIEAHVMGPLLMSHAVELHPWAVIVGVALGEVVAGVPGALFSVPLMAMVNAAVLYLRGRDKFPALGTDDAVFNDDATATADPEIGPTPADPAAAAAQRESHDEPDDGPSTTPLA